MQNRFNKTSHIYKIVSLINLNGENLNIPHGSTLDFQGGKIVNGTINLDSTKILPNGCIINDYITANITGTYAKGQCLFDAILNKPKWWTGTKWVDATGTEV